MNSQLYLVGLNYKTAPVEVRERFALTNPDLLAKGIVPLDGNIRECVILSTCNRVEITAVTRNVEGVEQELLQYWADAVGASLETLLPHVYVHREREAVRHLFTVASSLDSMVLGEPQILGQLKDAYRSSLESHNAKVILNRLLHKAFSVAKRVRSETAVASSAVSISYAAVELAKRIFDNMHEIHAMLIGAGEMAELAATHLVNAGIASVRVANRTYERAVQLARQYEGGEPVPFERLIETLAKVDIVISSTGAHEPIIRADDMKEVLRKRKNKPMFFIDIAVPRDIDPSVNSLDNIYLYDIDDLKEVVEENLAGRREEAARAALIVDEEADTFCLWLKSLALQPTIVDLIRRGENIARMEMERTLKRMGPLPEGAEEAIDAMLSALVKKLNHEPIMFLKRRFAEEEDAGTQHIGTVRRIFNLDGDSVMTEAHLGRGAPASFPTKCPGPVERKCPAPPACERSRKAE